MPTFSTPSIPSTRRINMYDAMVVGAGPAGTSAAFHLVQQGCTVLLVDRAVFPRDKSCGDAIMPSAMEELAHMGLVQEMQKLFPPIEYIATSVSGQSLMSFPLHGENKGVVAPREQFDELLWKHAVQHGASWLDSILVQECVASDTHMLVRGTHHGRPVQYAAKIVIAADGSGSRLAHKAREAYLSTQDYQDEVSPLTFPKDDRARLTAIRGYFRGIEPLHATLEFYFPYAIGNFYFWLFPVGNELVNVGMLVSMERLRRERMDFRQALSTFLSSPLLAKRTGHADLVAPLQAAPIAAGLRDTILFGHRFLCIGDAAALVDPSSAEGISGALWSGRRAAETAADAIRRDDVSSASLSIYGKAVRERYLQRYEQILAGLPSLKQA